MDSPEPLPQPQELLPPRPTTALPPEVEALHQQCQDLRLLFNATFLGLIALSLAVNLFFGKQMRLVRQQLDEQMPNFIRIQNEFTKLRDPEFRAFMNQLHRHASTHPAYQTNVLEKYRRVLPQYFNTVAMVGQPPPMPRGTNLLAPRPAGR